MNTEPTPEATETPPKNEHPKVNEADRKLAWEAERIGRALLVYANRLKVGQGDEPLVRYDTREPYRRKNQARGKTKPITVREWVKERVSNNECPLAHVIEEQDNDDRILLWKANVHYLFSCAKKAMTALRREKPRKPQKSYGVEEPKITEDEIIPIAKKFVSASMLKLAIGPGIDPQFATEAEKYIDKLSKCRIAPDDITNKFVAKVAKQRLPGESKDKITPERVRQAAAKNRRERHPLRELRDQVAQIHYEIFMDYHIKLDGYVPRKPRVAPKEGKEKAWPSLVTLSDGSNFSPSRMFRPPRQSEPT